MHSLRVWLIFHKNSLTHLPQPYSRKPVGQASCILLLLVAVMSPDNILSTYTAQSVLISTLSHFPLPASLLKSITLLLPTT